MKNLNDMKAALTELLASRQLRKLILSRPGRGDILRTEGRLFENKREIFLQLETFHKDGKATHRNLPLTGEPDAASAVLDLLLQEDEGYAQLNLLSPRGDLEARKSKSGKWLIGGKLSPADKESVGSVASHNHEKRYLLKEGVPYPFLIALGICSTDGHMIEKKRSKFLQINKFLENVEAVYPRLPKEGPVRILDLCCGKSYLTFAVYHYFTVTKGRRVEMLGADLKSDVIEYCSGIAKKLNYAGLMFQCCDIGQLKVPFSPHMVLSLHACDIATDIVLAKAIATQAEIILSTPCCHHELMGQVSKEKSDLTRTFGPITEHSMLRQKLCDALTDGLRCKMLEIHGYDVTVTELIDPEQTPKNLLIRAFRKGISAEKQEKLQAEYDELCRFCGVSPFLPKILNQYQTT